MEIQAKRINKKNIIRVIAIGFIIIVLIFAYRRLFVLGWETKYKDIKISYSKEPNNIVCVNFESKQNNILFYSVENNDIVLKQILQSPWNKSMRKKLSYGITYVDRNTILDTDGHAHRLINEDKLIFKFEDKKISMDLRDVATKVGIS